MNKKKHFKSISNFLKYYQSFCSEEILWNKSIEDSLNAYSHQLKNYRREDLIKLEAFEDYSFIQEPEFKSFLATIYDLNKVPKKKIEISFPQSHPVSLGLSKKKHHELNQIYNLLKEEKISSLNDYAGGRGLSSFFLSHHLGCSTTCFDFDSSLIDSGKKRSTSLPYKHNVSFHESDLTKNYPLNHESFNLSLHNCGELSVLNLSNLSKGNSFLNIACCFHKGESFNLSSIAQESPISYTSQALHCAAKSYKKLSIDEFEQRSRVKSFRYPLEMYIQKKGLTKTKLATKSKSKSLYQSSFKNYCSQLALPSGFDLDEAINFQKLQSTQEQVQHMIRLGIIRNLLGRLIEISICLDRSLFLEERGIPNNIFEIFSNELSPRNLAILSS